MPGKIESLYGMAQGEHKTRVGKKQRQFFLFEWLPKLKFWYFIKKLVPVVSENMTDSFYEFLVEYWPETLDDLWPWQRRCWPHQCCELIGWIWPNYNVWPLCPLLPVRSRRNQICNEPEKRNKFHMVSQINWLKIFHEGTPNHNWKQDSDIMIL